jgi:hypothetical protein
MRLQGFDWPHAFLRRLTLDFRLGGAQITCSRHGESNDRNRDANFENPLEHRGYVPIKII